MGLKLWNIVRRLTGGAHACQRRRVPFVIAGVLAVAAGIALVGMFGVKPSSTAHADHGGPHLDVLARSQFTDSVSGMLRVRLEDSHALRVIQLHDASDVIVARVSIPPGAVIDWHTHPGAAIAVVAQGELTITFGGDCKQQTYPAGTAWVHGVEAHPDLAENRGTEDMVMYVMFLGNPPGPATVPADDAGC